MAKIYQTQKDIDREQLTREVRDGKNIQSNLTGLGGFSTLLGVFSLEIDQLKEKVPSAFKSKFWKNFDGYFHKVVAGGGLILGIAALGAAFFIGRKTKQSEAELAELGPETVVLPPGVNLAPIEDGPHVSRLKESCCDKGKSI